jgi:hypothetical protein
MIPEGLQPSAKVESVDVLDTVWVADWNPNYFFPDKTQKTLESFNSLEVLLSFFFCKFPFLQNNLKLIEIIPLFGFIYVVVYLYSSVSQCPKLEKVLSESSNIHQNQTRILKR